MRVVIVYKNDSDSARDVLDFLRDFKRQTGHDLQTLEPESPDGEQFCRAYDIVEYPTVIALSDDSVMQNTWTGLPLPTISEVSYYVQ
ncbi:hypothetical protein EPN95_01625 [Patescibacteria group bacterium]|nr:MAG: hypothetical protein EPN95_01625 [Patescibacteria group bacterium]